MNTTRTGSEDGYQQRILATGNPCSTIILLEATKDIFNNNNPEKVKKLMLFIAQENIRGIGCELVSGSDDIQYITVGGRDGLLSKSTVVKDRESLCVLLCIFREKSDSYVFVAITRPDK